MEDLALIARCTACSGAEQDALQYGCEETQAVPCNRTVSILIAGASANGIEYFMSGLNSCNDNDCVT